MRLIRMTRSALCLWRRKTACSKRTVARTTSTGSRELRICPRSTSACGTIAETRSASTSTSTRRSASLRLTPTTTISTIRLCSIKRLERFESWLGVKTGSRYD
ncbi:hypothetical protein L596_006218 [Steinernema carpocapsae]|uniref:Uncharacterized protein n=1 Tax=Steinernema carpocapsae TaxID=34508 RepID=A0A4U8V7A8_STECR|nr:hypothetical protein L596_006218 [Steinernema carpocapsae]